MSRQLIKFQVPLKTLAHAFKPIADKCLTDSEAIVPDKEIKGTNPVANNKKLLARTRNIILKTKIMRLDPAQYEVLTQRCSKV